MNESRSVAVPRKKSFWKMVRTMLLPSRFLSTFASCGGIRGKRQRTLERMKRRDLQPRDRSLRQEDDRIPPPQIISNPTELEISFQDLAITSSALDLCSENDNEAVTVHTNNNTINNNVIPNPESLIYQDHHNLRNSGSNAILCNRTGSVSSEVYHPCSESSVIGTDSTNIVDVTLVDNNLQTNSTSLNDNVVVRRRKKADTKVDDSKFHGWRKSSIEVAHEPPLTLKWIPSGLQVGDKVMWVTDNQPERAIVRWTGKIRDQFYAGIEFERCIGNSSGIYGYGLTTYQRLFTCDLGFGRFVPVTELVLYSDFHDKGLKAGFICVICRDDFLELPDYHAAGDGQMVATKCGHLYHQYCLTEWFTKSKQLCHQCPHCQHVIEIDDIIRLFPAQV